MRAEERDARVWGPNTPASRRAGARFQLVALFGGNSLNIFCAAFSYFFSFFFGSFDRSAVAEPRNTSFFLPHSKMSTISVPSVHSDTVVVDEPIDDHPQPPHPS